MNAKQRAKRDAEIKVAMANLIQNQHFAAFIDVLREMREVSIEDACLDTTVASQRASMAAIGEIRAYKSIISVYDEAVNRTAEEPGDAGAE
jgi:hypothetical protein